MKILHTSDWHLGRNLYGTSRYEEFVAYFEWLINVIKKEKVELLLVAGDIFDTSTPSNQAQELYYDFLSSIVKTECKHVVITGGNHDSPSFLNAPKDLLRSFNIHVVGAITDNLEDEIIVIKNDDQDQVIICAVPYLRERDFRKSTPGETIKDKNQKIIEGIKEHYQNVCDLAKNKQSLIKKETNADVPIIAMGHLFMAEGKVIEGDGVRELYVGSHTKVGKEVFPEYVDYYALGHLHIPQSVRKNNNIRYCGSPIPFSFSKNNQNKIVLVIEFVDKQAKVKEIPIPCFQELILISGDLAEIQSKLNQLVTDRSEAWLEIEYTGDEIIDNLQERISDIVEGSKLEVLRVRNQRKINSVIKTTSDLEENLEDINDLMVFEKCLDLNNIDVSARTELISLYKEVITSMQEADVNEK